MFTACVLDAKAQGSCPLPYLWHQEYDFGPCSQMSGFRSYSRHFLGVLLGVN